MEEQYDIIILAAGSSSRLGSPKQSLAYRQTTLLKHSIEVALGSRAQQVIVVLGADAATIQPAIENNRLSFIVNDQWQEGIAASIRRGLRYLIRQKPAAQNVLFMVCDQPYITVDLLDKLVTLQKKTGNAIVASKYAETTGIPAIFAKELFPELLQLRGDAGARKLIMQQPGAVATVSFPLGDIDIDTKADYGNLRKM
ncbi:MAG TPA: nucleotidyltransferase family protein [Chitinophagaceae bacterium]|nr:nucleotidyltransferase family protein [Chitinophagaceae bacterium]